MKEPLLLIHGFTDTAATWRPVVPLLEPHHELIVPTVLGHHGGSPVPDDLSDPLGVMADDLERLLDDTGHDKVHIAGNSMGGWLAFEMAHRGRALDVVALSPAFGWEDEPPARTIRQFQLAHKASPVVAKYARKLVTRPGLRKLMFRDVVAHGDRIPPRTAYDLVMGSANCAIFPAIERAHEDQLYRHDWGDLGVPTRIAWGRYDRTLPFKVCSPWYKQALPDAEWVELPDCGHLPQHDDPELVAKTILEVTARERVAT